LGNYDGRREEGVGLGNDDGRGRHFGLRKYDGRRGEGVGLGNDDKRGRRVHCSKFLPVGRGVVNAVTGDGHGFYDGVGVGGRGRKGSGRRERASGRGM
jgi:hypothetical protein